MMPYHKLDFTDDQQNLSGHYYSPSLMNLSIKFNTLQKHLLECLYVPTVVRGDKTEGAVSCLRL